VTLKQELENAQARITELEGQIALADGKFSALDTEKNELSVKLTAAETKVSEQAGEIEKHGNEIKTRDEKISALETEKGTLTTRAEKAEGEANKLTAEAKDADTRAREIAAAAGVVLPPKSATGGNKTNENADKPAGSAREVLAAHINAQFAK